MSGASRPQAGGPSPASRDDAGVAAGAAGGSSGRELAGKKVLIGVTGGIACYKAATVVSRLVQAGASVRVLMTDAATKFVTPLTFESLSGQTVLTSLWQSDDHPESQHVGVARWADIIVIAPATANILAKLAAGLTDDVVSLALSAVPRKQDGAPVPPVLLAPAMNAQMWENPANLRNVETVTKLLGYRLIGPEEGWQACRTRGVGRMSEPEAIVAAGVAAGR